MKIRKVDGYWNYDKSEFGAAEALFDNDDKLEDVWGKQHSLQEFTSPSNFKSYDELKTRLDNVLAGKTTVGNVTTSFVEDDPVTVTVDTKEEPAPTVQHGLPEVTVTTDDDEDSMSYFEKLASDD